MSPTRPLARAAGLPLLALAVALALAAPRPVRAQSKADAFAGKIPPVAGQLYRKAGRFEATASGNLSLNDAFYNKYFGGLKLGYHLTESLSLSGQFTTGTAVRAGSAVVCQTNGGCEEAVDEQLFQVPGRIRMIAGAEIAWAPVYGKLNVFAERVAHFDVSLLLGADWISHDGIVSRTEAQALAAAGRRPDAASTFGGHVGLGARIFLTESIAARLEVKDYVYAVRVPSDGNRLDIQNQLFTELGISVFFPFQNRPLR